MHLFLGIQCRNSITNNIYQTTIQVYQTQLFIIRQIHFFLQHFLDLIHKLFLFQQEIFKVQNIAALCLSRLRDKRG